MKHFSSFFAAFISRSLLCAVLFLCPLCVSAAVFEAREVADRANLDRKERHLSPLSFDEALSRAAEMKAEDMAKKGYFAHTSPDGTKPWAFFDRAGYRYRYAGENLAIHFGDIESQETAWMKSEKHRANILSPKYRDIGVAVREIPWEGKTTVVVVQLFGTRLGEAVSDASTWESLSGDTPAFSGADISLRQRESSPDSLAPPLFPESGSRGVGFAEASDILSVSTPNSSDAFFRTLAGATFAGIGLLEVSALGIAYRIYVTRARRFRLRIATPM